MLKLQEKNTFYNCICKVNYGSNIVSIWGAKGDNKKFNISEIDNLHRHTKNAFDGIIKSLT